MENSTASSSSAADLHHNVVEKKGSSSENNSNAGDNNSNNNNDNSSNNISLNNLSPSASSLVAAATAAAIPIQLQLFPGEIIVRYFQHIGCTKLYTSLEEVQGSLVLTNFRLLFIPLESENTDFTCVINSDPNAIPLKYIRKLTRERSAFRVYDDILIVKTVDMRVIRFEFKEDNTEQVSMTKALRHHAFPTSLNRLFAFDYHIKQSSTKEEENRTELNELPTIEDNFSRLQLDSNVWTILDSNKDFALVASYPEKFIVPKLISNDLMEKLMESREYGRVPILRWYSASNETALFSGSRIKSTVERSSSMFVANKQLNETFRQLTVDTTAALSGLVVTPKQRLSRRPSYMKSPGIRLVQLGARLDPAFKDFEFESIALDLPSRGDISNSFSQLVATCSEESNDMTFFSLLDKSKWYHCILKYISGANTILDLMREEKISICLEEPVLSSGDPVPSDESCILCSLIMIIADPWYRTIQGFRYLLYENWQCMGYPFATCMGQTALNEEGSDTFIRSPGFILFLDAVCQLMLLNRLSFEFSFSLLSLLADQAYCGLFGDFIGDTEKERRKLPPTTSLWSYVFEHKDVFLNPLYFSNAENPRQITIPIGVFQLVFWKDYYLRHHGNAGRKIEQQMNMKLKKSLEEKLDLLDSLKKRHREAFGDQPINRPISLIQL